MAYISKFYSTKERPSRELSVNQGGWQKCEANHAFGPLIRDHYVIHFVKSGKGVYHCGSREYRIEKNQGFLIPPNQSTYYKADNDDPWEYYWVGFQGTEAKNLLLNINLSEENLVFTYDKDDEILSILDNLYFSSMNYESREYAMVGYLYLFFSRLAKTKQPCHKPYEEYLDKAVQYIEANFSYPITVTDISKHTGLDRSYLFRIFKATFQCSVFQYLMNVRLKKAAQMLLDSNVSITQISLSHGFYSLAHFSKLFKKEYGVSPKVFRNNS